MFCFFCVHIIKKSTLIYSTHVVHYDQLVNMSDHLTACQWDTDRGATSVYSGSPSSGSDVSTHTRMHTLFVFVCAQAGVHNFT